MDQAGRDIWGVLVLVLILSLVLALVLSCLVLSCLVWSCRGLACFFFLPASSKVNVANEKKNDKTESNRALTLEDVINNVILLVC